MLPPIEDLARATLEEIQSAIRLSLKPGWQLSMEFLPIGMWAGTLQDADANGLWYEEHVDQRILLFNLYGWLRQAEGPRPSHPLWRRRSEVQIPSQFGRKAYQGDTNIPDPEDLDPAEVASVYGLPTSARKEPK